MYGTASGVTALIPAIGTLGLSSTPTQAQAESWLTEATGLIDAALASAGYATDVDAAAAFYPVVVGMAQLYSAANAIQARGLDSSNGGDENRSEIMFRRFWAQLKLLRDGNLEALGVTVIVTSYRRRRLRTVATRRTDGYSAVYEGSAVEYTYPSE